MTTAIQKRAPRVAREPALMRPQEAADYLQLSVHTVRIWAQQGKLPCVKLGTSLRFKREALDEWIAKNEQGVS